MPKFTVGRFQVLVPSDDKARAVVADYHVGQVLDAALLTATESKFRRYVFMVLVKTAKLLGVPEHEFRARLLIESGRYEMVALYNSTKRALTIRSMNRSSMSDEELHDFWDDAVIIIRKMLPDLPQEVAAEIEGLLGSEGVRDADGFDTGENTRLQGEQ